MRWTVVVVLLAASTACEGGRARPSPTATTAASEAVHAAVEATIAKRTARFVVECRTEWRGGSFTVRREGVYDAPAKRASVTQMMRLDAGGSVARLFAGRVRPGRETAYAVVAGDKGFIRLPSWPPAIRERWKTYTEASNLVGVSVDVEALPEIVADLWGARGGSRDGDTYTVDVVPYAAATDAPSQCTDKLGSGVEATHLPDVPVEVEVRDGLVTKVSYDLIDMYRAAWKLADVDPDVRTVFSVEVTVTLTDHGAPAAIAVPSGSQLLSAGELPPV